MKHEDMKLGIKYKVIKDSDNGCFHTNDIILLEKDGEIGGVDLGWIPKEGVINAVIGMEVEPCKEYALNVITKSEKLIEFLKKEYGLEEV